MTVTECHLAISDVLRLEEIEGKGRGLVASQPLKAGQTVLRETPILLFSAFPLKRPQHEAGLSYPRYCAHCFRFLDNVGKTGTCVTTLTCPSCSDPDDSTFCSSKCYSLALSSSHTPWVCQALSYLRNCSLLMDSECHSEEHQVQARYLVAAYNLAMVSPPMFRALLSLYGDRADDGDAVDASIFLNSIFCLLPFPEGLSASAEMIAGLLAKEKRNSFCLMEPYSENGKRSTRAYGIYPNASFFNHDCMPNACRFDYPDSISDGNTDVIIRMMHDVPQGREACISYFCIKLRYEERKKRLLEYFDFECLCERCKVEKIKSEQDEDGVFPYGEFFERFLCDKENCGGTLAPLPPSNGSPSHVMECNFCGYLKKD